MANETRHKQTRQSHEDAEHASEERSSAPVRRDWQRTQSYGPFAVMRQGLDEIERWVGHWGRGGYERIKEGWLGEWSPAIEAFQRGNEFVIRADVPGMNRQDLQVEIGDDAVTIHGERKQDRQEERDGMFWTERNYGRFTRVIPLPSGALADSAKASFNNGVLEVVMQAPPAEARRGRRLEISGGDDSRK